MFSIIFLTELSYLLLMKKQKIFILFVIYALSIAKQNNYNFLIFLNGTKNQIIHYIHNFFNIINLSYFNEKLIYIYTAYNIRLVNRETD